MEIIRLPSSDVDTLEGAIRHMLSVCNTLPGAAINAFTQKFGKMHGHNLPNDFGTNIVMRQLIRGGWAFRTSEHLYSLNPLLRSNQKGIDAFWVFMEHMQDVDLATVYKPQFGELCYIKNNRIYSIIRCKGNGEKELAMAAQRELVRERHMRRYPKDKLPDERFFFIFSSKTAMANAPFFLKTPSLYCCIKYDAQWVPQIFFADPVQLRNLVAQKDKGDMQ